MPAIQWIQHTERVVGRGHSTYADVANRALRQLLELAGHTVDSTQFAGIHHFPNDVYTNAIRERTAGSGIDFISVGGTSAFDHSLLVSGALNVADDVEITGNVDVTGDLAVSGAISGNLSGVTFTPLLMGSVADAGEPSNIYKWTGHRVGSHYFLRFDETNDIQYNMVPPGGWRVYTDASVANAAGETPNPISAIFVTQGGDVQLNGDVYNNRRARFDFTRGIEVGADGSNTTYSRVVGPRKTGWPANTSASNSRADFEASTVTLPQLAERLSALINDLRDHGLIGT